MRRGNSVLWVLGGLGLVLGLAYGAWQLLAGPSAPPVVTAPVRAPPPSERPRTDLPEPPPLPSEPAPSAAAEPTSGSLAGRLVDREFHPVAAAQLELVEGRPTALGALREVTSSGLVAQSDGAGRFLFPSVPPSTTTLLRATGDSFAPTTSGPWVVRPARTTEVGDVLVAPSLSVAGGVFDEAGRALAGARVALGGGGEQRPSHVVLTDAQGRFAFPPVPQGIFEVVASAPGHARANASAGSLAGEATREVSVTLVLRPARPLSGRVLSRDGEEPVAGAEVLAVPQAEGLAASSTTSDAEGRFTFADLGRADHQISADAVGFLRDEIAVPTSAPADSVVLRLATAGAVSGHVVDPDGNPVSRYDIVLLFGQRRLEMTALDRMQRVRDADGRFRFDDLDPGWYAFEVWAKGYALSVSEAVKVVAGRELSGLEVALLPGAVLEGRVVRDDGTAVPGALVSLHIDRLVATPLLRNSASKENWYQETRTEADGRFRLTHVTERSYQVQVDHPDHAVVRRDGVLARAAETTTLEPFVLPRAALVRGVVLDATGTPVPRVPVRLWGRGLPGEHSHTNGLGEFVFARLPPGTYEVAATTPGRGLGGLAAQLARIQDRAPQNSVQVGPGDERSLTIYVE